MGSDEAKCPGCICGYKFALRRSASGGHGCSGLLGGEETMKGYIYTMYEGADPSRGWVMNDPTFRKSPTLGACVPNIRRAVSVGDHIFVISGRIKDERQFVVGSFERAEKINALAAYRRFPECRLKPHENGQGVENINVHTRGKQQPLDP